MLFPILLSSAIKCLLDFRSNWISKESFADKMTKLISNQIFLCISLFFTKLCICFNDKLAKPWSEAFGLTHHWSGTLVNICHPFLLSIGLSINIAISCSLFGSTIPQSVCWLALTLIEIWTIHSVIKLLKSDSRPTRLQSIPKTPKAQIRAERKPFYEKELNVKNLDLKPIGWTQFATTYKTQSNRSEDSSEALTLKVIDFEAYVDYYNGLLNEEKKAESIDKLSREFKLLHVISHENISKFIKVYIDKKKVGEIEVTHRLLLVSKWAPFSLHSYLEKESPNGVDRVIAKVWFKQLVGAVHYLHLQLKKNHMNIKPENILLFLKGQEVLNYIYINKLIN